MIASISLVLRVPEHVIFSSYYFFFLELNVQFPFLSFSFVLVLALFVFFCNFFFVLGTAGLDKLRLISRYYNISTLYIYQLLYEYALDRSLL